MDPVDRIRCDINRTLESERHICSPEIIVNGLRQCNDIQTFLTEQVRCLVRPVSSEYHKAVQVQLVICMLHRLYLVKAVLVRHAHQLERLSGSSQYGPSACQDSGEILCCEHTEVRIDQTLIPVLETVDLHIVSLGTDSLDDSAHRSVQSLTVTAACQHSDS